MVLRGVPRFAIPPDAVPGGKKESVRMSTRNVSSNMTRDRQRIAGIQKYFPATATLSIGNASYLQPAVIKVYQDDLDAETAVLVALAAYRTAVATAKTTRAKRAGGRAPRSGDGRRGLSAQIILPRREVLRVRVMHHDRRDRSLRLHHVLLGQRHADFLRVQEIE